MINKQIALITGVGRAAGIGYEVARQLSALDYKVIITSRELETSEVLAADLLKDGVDVFPLGLDIANEKNVLLAAKRVAKQFGKLDVLINNATLFPDRYDTLTADLADIKKVFDNNFIGYWRCIKYFVPLLSKPAYSRIVNISSAEGSYGDSNGLHNPHSGVINAYGLSKLAINGLTIKAAIDLKRNNILVNAVDPGFTASYQAFANLGARPVSATAKSIVFAATLPPDGPTGQFFRNGQPIAW